MALECIGKSWEVGPASPATSTATATCGHGGYGKKMLEFLENARIDGLVILILIILRAITDGENGFVRQWSSRKRHGRVGAKLKSGCNTLALYAFTLRLLVHLPLDFDTFALRFMYICP